MLDDTELARRVEIVISEYGGMIPTAEAFYIHSIIYSASRSVQAFQRFDIGRAVGDTEENQVSSIHEAMGHAAALSRFFWPSGIGRRKEHPSRLLKEARATRLRDALEHFDERLDLYLLENDAGYFFPTARIGEIALADDPQGHLFKLVDPGARKFASLGSIHDFGAVRPEIERIHDLAKQMDASGCRLPPE